MKLIESILFSVDFSERSAAAAQFATSFAKHFQAKLTVLHVVEIPPPYVGTVEFGVVSLSDVTHEMRRQAQQRLSAFPLADSDNLSAERVVVEGDAGREIVAFAHKHQVGLIIMPTHGLGPFRRFILGSVTAKVLHDAHCPVWTAVHVEEAARPHEVAIRKVVCAIDLGPHSEPVLRWAGSFAASYGAELLALHAEPMAESRPGKYLDQELFAALYRDALGKLENLVSAAGITAKVEVDGGEPAAVIRRTAEREKADVVIIGRSAPPHGLGRLRTHAYSIIRHSPCPVISV
jgi:nucleotide-binding universal stress UspA family protein